MRVITAFACLLLAPAAMAAEQIHWPSPFTSGTVLTYRETEISRSDGDEPEDFTTHADVTVRLTPSGNGNAVQRWEWGPTRFDVREGSPMMRRFYTALDQSPSPVVDVQLDADGRYAGVANPDVFVEWLQQVLGPIMADAMAEQFLADEAAEDPDEARVLAEEFTRSLTDIASRSEGLEAALAWVPTTFNGWLGGTYETGRDYTLPVTLPSVSLMRRFPTTLTYRFTALDGGKAQVTWSTEVEQGRFQASETGLIRFDRTSGVPEYYEANRTERNAGETSTTRTTYALQTVATP